MQCMADLKQCTAAAAAAAAITIVRDKQQA
jgi:hypothetical protein